MKISKELYNFFKDYDDWVKRGAPVCEPFERKVGLCFNSEVGGHDVRNELIALFEKEGLDAAYPFGEDAYEKRMLLLTQHECPKRLSFVRKHIKKYEEAKGKKVTKLKVGDKVKGVKFDNDDYPQPGWVSYMERYIGEVGTVVAVGTDCVNVKFNDDATWVVWVYPTHLLTKVEEGEHANNPKRDSNSNSSNSPKQPNDIIWAIVNESTGKIVSTAFTRKAARHRKEDMEWHTKKKHRIAKMVFDKWVR